MAGSVGSVSRRVICEGVITGYSGITTKVKIELYLERKTASSSTWSAYGSSSKTVNSYIGAHQYIKSVTSGYQYRVRAVYTAWSGSNSESMTRYSGVVSY
ncbi:MAG: hypothetical protein LBC83_07055 [Oscillospiraceae bacterium]|jgi:hypothetical protein|nr:hypothetical protein [Oscillospiraceae bacterium]